jgi:DNA-binding transcriptional MerR regulator
MKAISIGALAELSGVSERAIRLYEQHGLLRPQRTSAGRRTFGEEDVRRLLNVVALRALGCSLKEITVLAEQDAIDVARVLGMWTESIAAQQARLADVSQQLKSALDRITRGEAMPLDALCALLSKVDQDASGTARRALIDRWFSPAEQATWQGANAKAGAARVGGPQWSRLVRQVESAIERRVQPESAEGRRIGAKCAALMQPVQAKVDAKLWNRGATLMQEGDLAINSDEAQRTRRVYEWLSCAVKHHRTLVR